MYSNDKSKYREFDHTADVGIIARGESLSALFANLAFGMMSFITDLSGGSESRSHLVEIEEESLMELVINWLSEINYQLTVHRFLLLTIEKISVQKKPGKIKLIASLRGDESTPHLSTFKTEIKAVTYHQFKCEMIGIEYIAQVIFDI